MGTVSEDNALNRRISRGQLEAAMTTDESEIRDLLAKRDNALARGDATAVVAMMDSEIVSFDLPPPLRLIGEAARDPADLDGWFATWNGPIESKFTDPVVHVSV